MFTRKMLSETLLKCASVRCFSWEEQIYPVMLQIIKDKNFEILIQRSSPKSELSPKKVVRVKNFIISCLNPNPEARPSCSDLLNHKLFGGTYEYTLIQRHRRIFGINVVSCFSRYLLSCIYVAFTNISIKRQC